MRTKLLAWAILASLGVGMLIPTSSSFAIPTNFGGGGFINPAGMRFEDFAARADSWKQKADLKAPWERWNDSSITDTSIEVIKMSLDALVFGLPADQVLAYRKDETVHRFVVGFRPGKDRTLTDLDSAVRRNLGVWADSGSGNTFTKGATQIEILPAQDQEDLIQVSFTPAKAATVTAR